MPHLSEITTEWLLPFFLYPMHTLARNLENRYDKNEFISQRERKNEGFKNYVEKCKLFAC